MWFLEKKILEILVAQKGYFTTQAIGIIGPTVCENKMICENLMEAEDNIGCLNLW